MKVKFLSFFCIVLIAVIFLFFVTTKKNYINDDKSLLNNKINNTVKINLSGSEKVSPSHGVKANRLETGKMNDTLQESPVVKGYIDTSWYPKIVLIKNKKISYSFGNGNPSEVALSDEERLNLPDLVKKLPSNHTTYMTPEAELAMKGFLENPNLFMFLNKLQNVISYNIKDISLESIMYIDPETGRKEFKSEFISAIGEVFTYLRSPSNPDRWREYFAENDRVYLDGIESDFSKVIENYIIYERLSNSDIPSEIKEYPDIKNSTPPPGYKTDVPSDGIEDGKI